MAIRSLSDEGTQTSSETKSVGSSDNISHEGHVINMNESCDSWIESHDTHMTEEWVSSSLQGTLWQLAMTLDRGMCSFNPEVSVLAAASPSDSL